VTPSFPGTDWFHARPTYECFVENRILSVQTDTADIHSASDEGARGFAIVH